MLIPILAIVISLVAWALHLMQQAVDRREFSLMLAGTLVASSAAALVAVYFLMGSYVGYMTTSSYASSQLPYEASTWNFFEEEADLQDFFSVQAGSEKAGV